MSCGTSIPLKTVVEAIIDGYADTFAEEVIRRVSLDNSTINGGTLNDATIGGRLTLDEAAINSLCFHLKSCIAENIKEEQVELKGELAAIRSDLASTKSELGGAKVEQAELKGELSVLKSQCGKDGKDGKDDEDDNRTLNNVITIISETKETKEPPTVVHESGANTYIVSGEFSARDDGYWLDFTRNDQTKINVEMTDAINGIADAIYNKIIGMGYTIKTENNHYTTQAEDYNGHTIVRANRNGDQTITITKPEEAFIGKSLIVRKTNGDVGSYVTLKAGEGVTILPADSTPLRRVGSSATLVYVGEGKWDVFGELP